MAAVDNMAGVVANKFYALSSSIIQHLLPDIQSRNRILLKISFKLRKVVISQNWKFSRLSKTLI
jgi:hypothetical protein